MITELGNILEEFNCGLIEAGERISDLETGQRNSLKESSKKKEECQKVETASYGTTSSKIIFALQSPEGKGREKGVGNLFEETMAQSFTKLGKEVDIQIQIQRIPKREPQKSHTKTRYN